jgi:zinc and cadmium transporter
MDNTLIWIISATFGMSVIAWIGLGLIYLKKDLLDKLLLPLVALSTGALIGGAFLHIIPEALEASGEPHAVLAWVVAGFIVFFLLENVIHWHHGNKVLTHHHHTHRKPVTYLVLIADAVHNFMDGIAVGAAFLVDTRLGIITFFIAAAHEIPQELGDFGVLIYGGWEKGKALIANFVSALTAVLGGVLVYAFSMRFDLSFLLPFAAGTFIYIAASDLIPEIRHNTDEQATAKKTSIHIIAFFIGLAIIAGIQLIFPESH